MAAKAFDYGQYILESSQCTFSCLMIAHETLRKAHSALENCHCEDGCGNCEDLITSPFHSSRTHARQAYKAPLAGKPTKFLQN